MIFLNFRPLQNGSMVLIRGAYFRICSDGTLRGPDNTISARYSDGLWHLGQTRHVSFECAGPVYLRVTNSDGRRDCTGPYAALRAADGAIYTQDSLLGVHAAHAQFAAESGDVWHEVSFVSSR